MSNESLAEPLRQFVEDIARLLLPWGVPQTAARLYGYLLLSEGPVSLEQITADLQVSKSSASVAARLLEQYRLVRRHGERGSKRALYGVSNRYEDMMAEQNRLIQAMAELLTAGQTIAASASARDRLTEMAAFYLMMRETMDVALRRWQERKRA